MVMEVDNQFYVMESTALKPKYALKPIQKKKYVTFLSVFSVILAQGPC